MKKNNIGSSFDSWLREEGIYKKVIASALQRVLARQVEVPHALKHRDKTPGRLTKALLETAQHRTSAGGRALGLLEAQQVKAGETSPPSEGQ